MPKVTFEDETHDKLVAEVRRWLGDTEEDAEKITKGVGRLFGGIALAFVREAAEAAKRGENLVVGDEFARRFGKDHAGRLGGAIANAYMSLYRETGREVLRVVGKRPSVYSMTKEDAEHVLAALRKLGRG